MSNKKIMLSGLLAVVCMGLLSVLIAGCEDAKGINGLALVPPSASLGVTGGGTNVVGFTALIRSDLALPLKWSVANAALGAIVGSSGSNAVYVANAQPGDNIITVRDQYGNEGSAAVHQF